MTGASEIVATTIGLIGLAFAFYQQRQAAQVKTVVRKWGEQVCRRLATTREDLMETQTDHSKRGPAAWGQSRDEVLSGLKKLASDIGDIRSNMIALLETVTPKSAPVEEDAE